MQFVDLGAQYRHLKADIDSRIQAVLDHGKFIMGPEVAELETALADFSGARHVISCSSGTDALLMIMMARGIGPGDAVFVPSFTFTATAEAVLLLGAKPVFVDVDSDDFNIDLVDLEARIAAARRDRLVPKAILAVDLFGLPADYAGLRTIAERHGLDLWDDAAQSFGGGISGKMVGTLADATATSFFPAKPLGCYGDGGAVFTDDDALADILRSIRAHGKGHAKYDIVRVGLNARLDTVQAAILLAKLPGFAEEVERREAVAARYDALLEGVAEVATPIRRQGRASAWAQYTLKLDPARRDSVAERLRNDGVPSAVYYPLPMHLQTAYAPHGGGAGSLPVSERLSREVLSLPMHPYLALDDIERVATSLAGAIDEMRRSPN